MTDLDEAKCNAGLGINIESMMGRRRQELGGAGDDLKKIIARTK
jgi:hypothetical protein